MTRKTQKLPLLSMTMIMIAFLVYPWSRTFLPTVLVEVMSEFNLRIAAGGLLSSIYNLGGGIASLGAGYVSDRFGAKTTLQIGLALSAGTILLTSLATNFSSILLYTVLTGIGLAFWSNPCYLIMAGWFGENRRGFAYGLLSLAFGLGLFAGPLVASWAFVVSNNWRVPFILLSGVTFLILIAVTVRIGREVGRQPEVPSQSSSASRSESEAREEMGKGFILRQLSDSRFLAFSFAAIVVALMQSTFVALFVTYLRSDLSFTAETAAFGASFFGIGSLIGGFVAGYVGDKLGRKSVMFWSLLATIGVSYYLFSLANHFPEIAIFSLFLGALLSGFLFLNILLYMQEIFGAQHLGKATGYFYTLYAFSAVPSGFILGSMAESLGWHAANELFYLLLPIICLVALVASSLMHR